MRIIYISVACLHKSSIIMTGLFAGMAGMKYQAGDTFKILGFEAECPEDYAQKLLCFGFIPGHHFSVNRVAPLGDPLEVEIKGTSLSLRKSEIKMIKVSKV